MTKKCSHLTCDNMEKLVYLHEVWPQVRDVATDAGVGGSREDSLGVIVLNQ